MQPAVDPAAAASAASAPAVTLGWMLLLAIISVGILLVWFVRRVALARALEHWVRWLNPLVVLVWAAGVVLLAMLLLVGATLTQAVVRLSILVAFGLLTAPLLRDLWSGVVISIEGRQRLGDDIRVCGVEGRIVTLGLRSVVLRAHGGSEHTIPNSRFVGADVARLNLASGQAPFELEVVLHRPDGAEAAMIELTEAAVLSPLAAPGSLPEVFLIEADGATLRLRMRVYVFDRTYEERYRSDIIARVRTASPSGVLESPRDLAERDPLDPHA